MEAACIAAESRGAGSVNADAPVIGEINFELISIGSITIDSIIIGSINSASVDVGPTNGQAANVESVNVASINPGSRILDLSIEVSKYRSIQEYRFKNTDPINPNPPADTSSHEPDAAGGRRGVSSPAGRPAPGADEGKAGAFVRRV